MIGQLFMCLKLRSLFLNSQMCVAGIFENCTFEGLIGGGGSHGPVTSVAQAVTRLQILACHGTPPSYSSPPWLPSQTAPRSLKILREREEEEDIITDKQQLPTILPFRQTLNLISVAQSNITFQKSLISWVRCPSRI